MSSVAGLLAAGAAVPVCPEVLGGLGTPRRPAEIVGGDGTDVLDGAARVLDDRGADVTAQYLTGAAAALRAARATGARRAVLADGSPSCGSSHLHDGSFAGRVRPGVGVTAALLRREGIEVTAGPED